MCAGNGAPCNRWYYKKVGFLQGFTGGRDRRGCVLGMERLVIVGTIKKLDFCKASPGEETEKGVCFERGA